MRRSCTSDTGCSIAEDVGRCMGEGKWLGVNVRKLKAPAPVLCIFCGALYSATEVLSYSSQGSATEFTICPVCKSHTHVNENPVKGT